MRAVCLRCGHAKADAPAICPGCGHRPADDGLLVAWLLSADNLAPDDLLEAGRRIAEGERLRPSQAALRRAARALGRSARDDAGLSRAQRLGLLALSTLITPWVGLAFAWTWWDLRPRSARQALWVTLPAGLCVTAAWAWRVYASHVGG
jgi:hypothetical protein